MTEAMRNRKRTLPNNEASLVRIQPGVEPGWSIIEPDDPEFPPESEVFDMGKAEIGIGNQVIRALIADPSSVPNAWKDSPTR